MQLCLDPLTVCLEVYTLLPMTNSTAHHMASTHNGVLVEGFRHNRTDGRECFCGCQHVEGLAGSFVQDSDTPKLLALDEPMRIVEFMVPSPAGGPARAEQVAYSVAELDAWAAKVKRGNRAFIAAYFALEDAGLDIHETAEPSL